MNKLVLIALLLTASCATILNDETQTITVSSTKDIKGTINGVAFKAPGIVMVRRKKQDQILNVSTKGCNQQVALNSQVDSKFFINILSGGTFGSSTDYSTEKMWKYQDQVIIHCNK